MTTYLKIKERKKEIKRMIKGRNVPEEEIRSLNAELDGLDIAEDFIIENAEDNPEARDEDYPEQRGNSQERMNVLGTYGVGASLSKDEEVDQRSIKNLEQRSADFENGKAIQFDLNESELRSITIGANEVALTTHSSKQLNPTFNEVSSIVDLTKNIPLPGGESYKSGFVVSIGDADYTDEGEDYHDNTDVKTDYVNVDKAKITTYFELSEEVQKLGGRHYVSFALQAARNAVRKKMGQQILIGAGGTNALHGIFNAPANVIPGDTDLEVSSFDETVLDDIVFNHGGEESVEGGAYLILNKKTLAQFSKVRATDGKRLYTIKLDRNGSAGTISSEESFEVPFVINSSVKSFEDAAEGEYFLAYGKPMAYEIAMFSGLEIQESRDFKFKSGQIAVKASILAGGNTASYKGFTRVKKVI